MPKIRGKYRAVKIGYVRVSTEDRNPDLQLATLKQAGCQRIFTDKATGAYVKRAELTKCLKVLVEGDTLIVWKLDRLGCSLRDLIGLLDDLKKRGVAFHSIGVWVATQSKQHLPSLTQDTR